MKKTPFLLDGAMGTELNNRGVKTELPLWTADANILHPDLVQNIHSEYIDAGADYITTNTFRSTSWTYKRAGYTNDKAKIMAKKSLYSGVKCAQNASKGVVKIAGSITTLDDCYTPENFPGRNIAIDVFKQTLDWLIDAGVDIILFETMGNIEEIEIALSLSTEYNKVELSSENEIVKIPSWCIHEITGVKKLSNAALAQLPISDWSTKELQRFNIK